LCDYQVRDPAVEALAARPRPKAPSAPPCLGEGSLAQFQAMPGAGRAKLGLVQA